jgi:hypothetical protein
MPNKLSVGVDKSSTKNLSLAIQQCINALKQLQIDLRHETPGMSTISVTSNDLNKMSTPC